MKASMYGLTVLAVVAATLSGCYDLAGPGPMGDREALGEDPEISEFEWSSRLGLGHPQVVGAEIKAEGGVGTVRFEGGWGHSYCLALDGYVRRGEGVLQFEIHFTGIGGCPTSHRAAVYQGVLRQLDPGSYRIRIVHTEDGSGEMVEKVVLDTVVVVE